jgi:hypothetical protein
MKTAHNMLLVVLAILIVVIVGQNAPVFALIQGTCVNVALVVCALIIGLKIQMRMK